jgi:signal transduction histidine kinase
LRLPIRARLAVFAALVVCATVVVFAIAIYGLVWVSGLRTVDHDLLTGNTATTFGATAAVDGTLQAVRDGGGGRMPARLPLPVRTGYSTIVAGPNDRVRLYVQAEPDGSFNVTGEHLTQLEGAANVLLVLLFFTAVVTMVAGVIATWLVAGRALRPLREMARVAADVGRTSDLARQLPEARPRDDEVGRLTSAFNDMLRRLEGAQESQRRFVADASHELRTPLTSIRGNAGLLLRDPPPAPEDAREAAVDISAESERMSRLVDGLLTLARADAGQTLRRQSVDLAQVVEPVARRAGLTASLAQAPVDGDADALAQLAWILADNVRRHGGGEGTVWVRPRPEGGATMLVGDQGPGIPPGEEQRIFERFYQPDRSRSRGGTGLGLAIARWIVEQHGGRIWAGKNPGGGALFAVQL